MPERCQARVRRTLTALWIACRRYFDARSVVDGSYIDELRIGLPANWNGPVVVLGQAEIVRPDWMDPELDRVLLGDFGRRWLREHRLREAAMAYLLLRTIFEHGG